MIPTMFMDVSVLPYLIQITCSGVGTEGAEGAAATWVDDRGANIIFCFQTYYTVFSFRLLAPPCEKFE